MADRYAVASGLWSDPATWDGGLTIPSDGDDVDSGAFTVAIDVSAAPNSLTGAQSGGLFVVPPECPAEYSLAVTGGYIEGKYPNVTVHVPQDEEIVIDVGTATVITIHVQNTLD